MTTDQEIRIKAAELVYGFLGDFNKNTYPYIPTKEQLSDALARITLFIETGHYPTEEEI